MSDEKSTRMQDLPWFRLAENVRTLINTGTGIVAGSGLWKVTSCEVSSPTFIFRLEWFSRVSRLTSPMKIEISVQVDGATAFRPPSVARRSAILRPPVFAPHASLERNISWIRIKKCFVVNCNCFKKMIISFSLEKNWLSCDQPADGLTIWRIHSRLDLSTGRCRSSSCSRRVVSACRSCTLSSAENRSKIILLLFRFLF